ncbi:MAG: flagellar biosynthetic protein FliO [Planctomycetota bacterium]|nr:flagellar biosynthetic protein FliO [Planctomycetota bacterium]
MRLNFWKLTLCALLLALAMPRAARAEDENEMVLAGTGKAAAAKSGAPLAMTTSEQGSSSLRVTGTLLLFFGLLGGGVLMLRRMKNATSGGREAAPSLQVMERLSLGLKRELLMVRAGEHVLVLAALNQDVKLIASMPAPNAPAAAAPAASPAGEPSFEQLLGRFQVHKEPEAERPASVAVPSKIDALAAAFGQMWPSAKER